MINCNTFCTRHRRSMQPLFILMPKPHWTENFSTTLKIQVRRTIHLKNYVVFFKKNHVVDLPSPTELSSDITKLAQSTRTLFTLLLTSSAFRAILSSLFAITREVLASTASSVASVAAHIEAGATEVERAARLDDISFEGVQGRVAEAFGRAKEAGSDIDGVGVEGADKLRDQVIGRIQEVLLPLIHTFVILIFSLWYRRQYQELRRTRNTVLPSLLSS